MTSGNVMIVDSEELGKENFFLPESRQIIVPYIRRISMRNGKLRHYISMSNLIDLPNDTSVT